MPSDALGQAIAARLRARAISASEKWRPLQYRAWQYVTSCERALTDDEFAAYQARFANE